MTAVQHPFPSHKLLEHCYDLFDKSDNFLDRTLKRSPPLVRNKHQTLAVEIAETVIQYKSLAVDMGLDTGMAWCRFATPIIKFRQLYDMPHQSFHYFHK